MQSELIVHVGNGKTGTSSIQKTLLDNASALDRQGVRYLGYALERCETQPHRDWQTPGNVNLLLNPEKLEQRHAELFDTLTAEMAHLAERGIYRAVWSNEALFLQNSTAVHALKRLQEAGVKIKVICYLRRHDLWAKSAYAQWGIKHKTYPGPVKPFSEWVRSRSLNFAPAVNVWQGHFGGDFNLRNFDAIGDVSADFLSLLGVSGIDPLRVYETPSPEVLALWAYFNSLSPDPVLPDKFQQVTRRTGIFAGDAPKLPPIEKLLPSDEELAGVLERNRRDIEEINAILEQKGQPGFMMGSKPQKPVSASSWDIDQLLLRMVFSLQEQLDALKKRLRDPD